MDQKGAKKSGGNGELKSHPRGQALGSRRTTDRPPGPRKRSYQLAQRSLRPLGWSRHEANRPRCSAPGRPTSKRSYPPRASSHSSSHRRPEEDSSHPTSLFAHTRLHLDQQTSTKKSARSILKGTYLRRRTSHRRSVVWLPEWLLGSSCSCLRRSWLRHRRGRLDRRRCNHKQSLKKHSGA